MTENAIIERLKTISLFKEFKNSTNDLKRVASIINTKVYAPSECIIKEGDLGSEMFILNKGSVHIDRKTLQNDTYRLITLSADMNVFFGEQALMDSDKRSATVIAGDECELFIIKQDDFINLGDEHPKLGLAITREITKKISADLRKANRDIITLFEALVGELEDDVQP
jgi:CRP/FNR family transcriptional regulator, cyclic AMP receptor protein